MGGTTPQQYEVLDEQGHKTGQILDRDTIHQKEFWHEVVNVWIVNTQGDVLLQLRGPQVDLAPNVWDVAIGSHVRPAEDPIASAQRCLRTELGISITPDQLKHLFNIQSANPAQQGRQHKTLGHVFLLKRDINLSECTVDPNKIAKLVWRPLIQVMADIGNSETSTLYFPRSGNYYPQLFEALEAGV